MSLRGRGVHVLGAGVPLLQRDGMPPDVSLMMDSPSTWEEALDAVLAEMRTVMVARQRKYSRRNIEEQGLYGVLTRATADKLSRVMTSLNGRVVHGRVELDDIRDAQDETFEDGLIDAANYIGPIALMLKRGWWSLPDGPELSA